MALVTGIVVDSENNPLQDVHVFVKGSNPLIGVVTNSKGNFVINADAYKTLVVSFAGSSKEFLVLAQPQFLNVEFGAEELSEYVGTAKPKNGCGLFCALLIVTGVAVLYEVISNSSTNVEPRKLKI